MPTTTTHVDQHALSPQMIPVAYARPGSKKGKLWQRIHGRLSVPLESAQPIEAGSPLGRRMFLFVNIWRCGTRNDLERIVARLAVEWRSTPRKVWRDLLKNGLPLMVTEDVEVRMEPASAWPVR